MEKSTIIGNLVRKKGRGENEDIDIERRQKAQKKGIKILKKEVMAEAEVERKINGMGTHKRKLRRGTRQNG